MKCTKERMIPQNSEFRSVLEDIIDYPAAMSILIGKYI